MKMNQNLSDDSLTAWEINNPFVPTTEELADGKHSCQDIITKFDLNKISPEDIATFLNGLYNNHYIKLANDKRASTKAKSVPKYRNISKLAGGLSEVINKLSLQEKRSLKKQCPHTSFSFFELQETLDILAKNANQNLKILDSISDKRGPNNIERLLIEDLVFNLNKFYFKSKNDEARRKNQQFTATCLFYMDIYPGYDVNYISGRVKDILKKQGDNFSF
ncbi:hypothetical protein ACJJID_16630 [Microbulbifer sp. CnH-101-G]|uniref:hypothetical protein n=1 Tax=Microbulbifer sp. CnH-101-G TaxID=3243393 RepID=UPI00403A2D4B